MRDAGFAMSEGVGKRENGEFNGVEEGCSSTRMRVYRKVRS